MELCEAPISQCTKGHVLCHVCQATLDDKARAENQFLNKSYKPAIRCPICRENCKDWSRNISLEKMAAAFLQTHSYPCPNDCGLVLTYGRATEHITECRKVGIACLISSCEKKLSRSAMAQHVLSAHRVGPSALNCTAGGPAINLSRLEPIEFTAFSPKNSSLGHYILLVHATDATLPDLASWILVKRHRKSHIEIALECLHAREEYKNLAYVLTASNAIGTHMAMTITSTTHRIRNEEERGIVVKDSPAYMMNTFQVDAKNQSTLELRVEYPRGDEAGGRARKRARIELSSDDEEKDV